MVGADQVVVDAGLAGHAKACCTHSRRLICVLPQGRRCRRRRRPFMSQQVWPRPGRKLRTPRADGSERPAALEHLCQRPVLRGAASCLPKATPFTLQQSGSPWRLCLPRRPCWPSPAHRWTSSASTRPTRRLSIRRRLGCPGLSMIRLAGRCSRLTRSPSRGARRTCWPHATSCGTRAKWKATSPSMCPTRARLLKRSAPTLARADLGRRRSRVALQ